MLPPPNQPQAAPKLINGSDVFQGNCRQTKILNEQCLAENKLDAAKRVTCQLLTYANKTNEMQKCFLFNLK